MPVDLAIGWLRFLLHTSHTTYPQAGILSIGLIPGIYAVNIRFITIYYLAILCRCPLSLGLTTQALSQILAIAIVPINVKL